MSAKKWKEQEECNGEFKLVEKLRKINLKEN